jgi:hypothetical protein
MKIISCIFSGNDEIKLDINSRRNYKNCAKTCRLYNTLWNVQWVIEEIREETKKFLEFN